MKPLFLSRSLLLCLIIVFAEACTKEDYSLKTNYVVSLCVVKESSNQDLYLLSDQGNALYPSSSLKAETSGQRYQVTYKVMDGTSSKQDETTVVSISNMNPVLIKEVVSRSLFTGSMNDFVWLECNPWSGGGYLNFEFIFDDSDSNIKHSIYLVQDSTGNAGKNIHLTFGHDANGDTSGHKATALASFPFSSISGIQKADSLIIKVLGGTEGSQTQTTYKLAVPDDVKNS
jgi:hypothetical protein